MHQYATARVADGDDALRERDVHAGDGGRQAGVEERRLRDCLTRRGIDVSDSTVTFEDQ
jgi:hypothetical protein